MTDNPDPMSASEGKEGSIEESFSFDLRLFHRRIEVGDDWQRVIQGHLFLDHVLTRTLEEALTKPDEIRLDRMSFSAKLDLCSALGLIDEGTVKMVRRINRLRNDISHDLNFEVHEYHGREIRDLAPPFVRGLIEERIGVPDASIMTHCLKVAIVTLDMNRQRWIEHRKAQKAREVRLNAAIENARRILEETKAREPRTTRERT
ncbi:hypothetical protein [Sphingomonas sp. NFX23]|uniref:hypothetical protein n=1 Tax=Sphingomonas sp. NFX23 TaxID=2819532 RepID=UPI003CF4E09F